MTKKSVICFYHKHCVDGTTAASVILRKFPEARTFPLGFDSKEEDLAMAVSLIKEGDLVILVDTTLGIEEVLELGNEILVLDHHVSEKKRIEVLAAENEKLTYVFDQKASGASLAFEYYFSEQTLPQFIEYVRDIDLWNNKFLPESAWLQQYLSTLRNHPEELLSLFDSPLDASLKIGKLLHAYVDQEVAHTTKLPPIYIDVDGTKVPAYNITNHQSKAGNVLSLKTNKAVILYVIQGEKTRLSLRSIDGCDPNAREIAQFFGGGGHDHSAGATVATKDFLSILQA